MIRQVAVAVLLGAGAVPGVAQVSSIESNRSIHKGSNPDKVVCESEETTGTRLGARRVCMTVAQWADKRREHREALERVQRTPNQAPSN